MLKIFGLQMWVEILKVGLNRYKLINDLWIRSHFRSIFVGVVGIECFEKLTLQHSTYLRFGMFEVYKKDQGTTN